MAFLLIFVFADAANRPEAAIPYFTNVRDVRISQPDYQNYFIVDEEIWAHSRPDLGDLRLYAGESPVPYAISEQDAGVSSEEVEADILNLGTVSGHTEFDLDASSLREYDRVRLRIEAHDFVATASVSGGNEAGKATEVKLPSSTLYDFSKEQLGSNSQVKLPASSFHFLHIKLSPGIEPKQVKGATIFNVQARDAVWTAFGSCAAPEQQQHNTEIVCNVPDKVPVRRVLLHVAAAETNFHRTVGVKDSDGVQFVRREISRVRFNRGRTLVTNEELAISISGDTRKFTLIIDNADNPALSITSVEPLAFERRVYFDAQGKSALQLYYGDESLPAPIYDYARFFHVESTPAQAQLLPGAHNPRYSRRPDSRPWSERHTVILWTAMLLTVLGLSFLAVRGLRKERVK
jgi:hypothetical protein